MGGKQPKKKSNAKNRSKDKSQANANRDIEVGKKQ